LPSIALEVEEAVAQASRGHNPHPDNPTLATP
jgi:hypothetical protein